ncbi:hypothetical protein STIAU_2918 [Stigmatella aurantiaca DW4/3-1]|uniref:Uncharacterized protein n=2 Tax=Stigmatella aurantiaca TaxID=41 RepID=Q09D14_STIAD|nr:hypothetical protein STIAU_2918 [Stigmatella aurantiaca DW4/3-1]
MANASQPGYGQLWTEGLNKEGEDAVYGRYTEALFPDGRRIPVCFGLGDRSGLTTKDDGSKPGQALLPRRLIPLAPGVPLENALTDDEQQLVSRYKAWCRSAQNFQGDCLGGALVAGQYLDLQGRYMWAMALSKSPLLEEFENALGHIVSMQAVVQAATATVVTLLVLLAMPEPVTKFIAAWATAGLILWIGAQTHPFQDVESMRPEARTRAVATC